LEIGNSEDRRNGCEFSHESEGNSLKGPPEMDVTNRVLCSVVGYTVIDGEA